MQFFSALLLVALIITPSVVKCDNTRLVRCNPCCPVQCCKRNITLTDPADGSVLGCRDATPRAFRDLGCAQPLRTGTETRAPGLPLKIKQCPFKFGICNCRSSCFANIRGNVLVAAACNGQNPDQEVFGGEPPDVTFTGGDSRRLDGVLMELDNFGWEEYKHKCNGFSYELRLYVDWHIMLLAVPDDEAVAVGCAPLALHSVTKHHNGTWEKQALVYDKRRLEGFNKMKKDSIELHSHQFSDIAVGYELAETGGTSTDVVLSNCGDFARNFCAIVGEKFTPAMTMDIARRLIEKSEGDIVAKIHSSDHVRTLVEGGGDSSTSDEELVYRLVESRTRELYNL